MKKPNPHHQSQKQKGETISARQGIANVFVAFYESLYEGEEDDEEQRTESRNEEDERTFDQHDPIPEFLNMRFKMPSIASKKEKQKTNSSGVRAEQLKNCSDVTKEKRERSSK